ncbi:MAG: ABC transporter permease [bacterium]|jgi:molybdate/tungstate transport system permease protein
MTIGLRKISGFELAVEFAGALLILFIAAPLVRLVLGISAGGIADIFRDRELWTSIALTFRCAAAAAILGILFGVPLAYVLARSRFRCSSLIQGIVDLPVMVPHSAAGIALLGVLGRHSLAQKAAAPLGIEFAGTEAGIALAMTFVSVPFLVNAARAGFEAVPVRLENAARSLGAAPARVFFSISLPLAWRSILGGAALMWGRGISEFGAVIIIAYHPATAPVLVFQRFSDFGLNASRSAAAVLVVAALAVFAILRAIGRANGGEPR